jgi:8-oxo-dGTP pyrophosphatase MutT (NUDIX family)
MSPPKHIVSAAVIVITEENEILLFNGPRRGWEMSGGQVEEGESLSQAYKCGFSRGRAKARVNSHGR